MKRVERPRGRRGSAGPVRSRAPPRGDAVAPPPPPTRELLLQKYQALAQKYHALVSQRHAAATESSHVATLALSALRASRTARAVLRDGVLVLSNPQWHGIVREHARWRSLTAEDVRGEPEYADLETLVREEARELADDRAQRTRRFERGDRVLEVRLERVPRDEGTLLLVHVDDVTGEVQAARDLARARQRMFEQERLRSVGELASGIAHDLNNTLHAIGLHLGVLAREPAVMGACGEAVESVRRIVRDAATRIARLQEVARIRTDAPAESFAPGDVVRDAVAFVRPELEEKARVEGIDLEVVLDLPPTLPRVLGVASELRYVFMNLLLNARDAMPRGGSIRISAREGGGRVTVTVADDGEGIPESALPRIFDPFFSTKGERGTGLGLAIAQGVLARLGGSIGAANRAGGGAVFTLDFPVGGEPPAPEPPVRERVASRSARVLVVDDDADNLEVTREALALLGHEADVARNGEEALALLSGGAPFDVVFCDVGMPGLSGWEVAERARRLAPRLAIYMLTGWAQEVGRDDPRRALVDGVVGKPVELEQLGAIVASALEARPARA